MTDTPARGRTVKCSSFLLSATSAPAMITVTVTSIAPRLLNIVNPRTCPGVKLFSKGLAAVVTADPSPSQIAWISAGMHPSAIAARLDRSDSHSPGFARPGWIRSPASNSLHTALALQESWRRLPESGHHRSVLKDLQV